MKIDIHTHILPKEWPDLKKKFGYGGWIQMEVDGEKGTMVRDDGFKFRSVDQRVWSPDARIQDMERTGKSSISSIMIRCLPGVPGVDFQVLSTVPVMFNYWAKAKDTLTVDRILNDHMASLCHKHPHKFMSMGTIPLQDPELSVEEMKRCKHDLKMNGIMIGTHVNDEINLSDRFFDPIFQTAVDHDIPLFIHPWGMRTNGRHKQYWLPWLTGMMYETSTCLYSMMFGGTFERYPMLKVCFAHGAGSVPYTVERASHCHHVYPDDMQMDNPELPSKYLKSGNIFADTILHSEKSLKLASDVLGDDHLILGSDYPFLLGEQTPGEMIRKSGPL